MYIERITHYHFKTKSKSIAKAIEIVARDHKARELLFYFDKIEKTKKRNIILRMADYLKL